MASEETEVGLGGNGDEEVTGAAKVGAAILVLAVLAAFYLLVKALYPNELHLGDDPSFVDTVFDNKTVVLAARLVLFSLAIVLAVGGLFVIMSTFVRMANREWLKRAGPFEISELAISELEGQIQFWRNTALASQEESTELAERLQASDELLEAILEAQDDDDA